MEFDRDLLCLAGGNVAEGALDGNRVVHGVHEEGRWSRLCYGDFIFKGLSPVIHEVRGVNQNGEVRAALMIVSRVDLCVGRRGVAADRGEVSAGGEAHDADFVRIET